MVSLSAAPSDASVTSRRYLKSLFGEPVDGGHMAKSKPSDPALDDLLREIGDRIRASREANGWSREEFTQRTGLGWRTLQNYENGGVRLSRISQLAEVLGVDPRWLLHGDRGLQEQLEEQRELLARLEAAVLREPPESGPMSGSGS